MKLPQTVFSKAKGLDKTVFTNVSRVEALGSLFDCFERWEKHQGYLDPEPMEEIGILFGESDYDNLDKETWSWFCETPSMTRHEIVADFLWGYWNTSKIPNLEVIQMLMDSMDEVPPEHWAFAASLFALNMVYGRGRERLPKHRVAGIREVLLHRLAQLEANGLHKGLAGLLRHVRKAEGQTNRASSSGMPAPTESAWPTETPAVPGPVEPYTPPVPDDASPPDLG